CPRVVLDVLDRAADLKEPVLVVGVSDGQRNPWLVREVGELLPGSGVRHADARSIPGEPHDAALRAPVRPHRGEVREEWLLKQIDVAVGHFRHQALLWSPGKPSATGESSVGKRS